MVEGPSIVVIVTNLIVMGVEMSGVVDHDEAAGLARLRFEAGQLNARISSTVVSFEQDHSYPRIIKRLISSWRLVEGSTRLCTRPLKSR